MAAFNHNNNYGPIRLEDISISRELRERERAEREGRERMERERLERERERHFSNSSYNSFHRDTPFEHLDRQEDEWKHIENVSELTKRIACMPTLTILYNGNLLWRFW